MACHAARHRSLLGLAHATSDREVFGVSACAMVPAVSATGFAAACAAFDAFAVICRRSALQGRHSCGAELQQHRMASGGACRRALACGCLRGQHGVQCTRRTGLLTAGFALVRRQAPLSFSTLFSGLRWWRPKKSSKSAMSLERSGKRGAPATMTNPMTTRVLADGGG